MRERHPLVREVLDGAWSADLLVPLLDAWRTERTSELADVIGVLGEAIDVEPCTILTLEDLAGWPAAFDRAPSAALLALSTAATATFRLLEAEDPGPRSPRRGAWLDAVHALNERWWRGFTEVVATLRDHPPDPRIGRALLAMLASPSDHWFRVDQVAHVAGPFDQVDDAPSFADVMVARVERDADAGTADALDASARHLLVEADCNSAEMSSWLRSLAPALRSRHGVDRQLDDVDYDALCARGPVGPRVT